MNTCSLAVRFPISFVANVYSMSAGNNVLFQSDDLEVVLFSCSDVQTLLDACPLTQTWDIFQYDFERLGSSIERFSIIR